MALQYIVLGVAIYGILIGVAIQKIRERRYWKKMAKESEKKNAELKAFIKERRIVRR